MNMDNPAAREALVAAAKRYAPEIRRVTNTLGKLEIRRRRHAGDRYLEDFPRRVQLDDYSCGLQCALAVLEYYRVRITEATVRDRLQTDEDGTSSVALRRMFRGMAFRLGTVGSSIRATIERSVDLGAPLILGVDRSSPHWVVVYGYGPGRVYLADPSLARKWSVIEKWKDFKRRADGTGMSIQIPRDGICAARRRGTVIEVG